MLLSMAFHFLNGGSKKVFKNSRQTASNAKCLVVRVCVCISTKLYTKSAATNKFQRHNHNNKHKQKRQQIASVGKCSKQQQQK